MRKDLEQKFKERWPTWFDLDGSPQQTSMAWGFAHGDGWFDLVWQLCEHIAPNHPASLNLEGYLPHKPGPHLRV